jgi:hypothetical protein
LCHVVWWKLTDISELLVVSIVALMMEAASTPETSVNLYQATCTTTQQTATFILTAVKT